MNGKSARDDVKPDEELLETLDKLNLEENYLPWQMFSIDETFLFWKRMPEKTFIHKEANKMSGLKALKGRKTLIGAMLQSKN